MVTIVFRLIAYTQFSVVFISAYELLKTIIEFNNSMVLAAPFY